jgi:hypothetical protein
VKLFKKAKSKFYWYDFTVRGQRYRGSTNETKAARAAKVAGLKLAHVVENTDPLPQKAPVLLEFSRRFLEWLDKVRLEDKTKTYYRDGWRLLKTTTVVNMRLDQIKCQLRAENVKKNAAQGGGVDTDSPRSETQTDEGIRTFTQA